MSLRRLEVFNLFGDDRDEERSRPGYGCRRTKIGWRLGAGFTVPAVS